MRNSPERAPIVWSASRTDGCFLQTWSAHTERRQTYAFIAAALIAPAKLAYKGVLLQTLGRSLALVVNPLRKPENRREISPELMTWFRLGPAIFVGAAVTVLLHWDLP